MTFWLLNEAIYDLFKFLLKHLAFVKKKKKTKKIIYTLQIWNIFYSQKKKKKKLEYFELFSNF